MTLKEKLAAVLENKGENYIFPFFWQHGEEEEVLRHYMQVIHDANIGAVCVESRPHPDFAGEKWWADMDAILDEAEKLGMKVWILDDSHFPTGFANGAVKNAPMELQHQYLDHNDLIVAGPAKGMEIPVGKMAGPKEIPFWLILGQPAPPKEKTWGDDRLMKVTACRVMEQGLLGEMVDLTDLAENGTLYWDVPAGAWRVVVTYLTRDAKGRNDYINFLDRDSCRLLIDAVYEPHWQHYKEKFGKTILGFFSDEPPVGNTPTYTTGDIIGRYDMPLPWSAAMPQRMTEEYGEGWQLKLPLLWARGEAEETARIRTGYMNACSKLVAECFSEQLGKWCEAHGVEYIGHMLEDCDMSGGLGPSMGHFFRGLSGQHMAGIDNIGGQVVPGYQDVPRHDGGSPTDEAGFYQYTIGRMGASMAAVYPHQKGRCLCENFGAYGWSEGVRLEKYLLDHFLARGVNHYVPHAFSPKAFPDPDCPPHFYAHGENPQYRAFGELMAYGNRVCELISGGKPVTNVALLYHGESQWGGAYESNVFACRQLTRHQFGFTMLPADVFEQPEQFGTAFDPERKLLRVNGLELRAFVISGCDSLTAPAAEFAAKACEAGFPVIFTGRLPLTVGDLPPAEAGALTARLQSCTVTPVENLAAVLDEILPRDVETEGEHPDLTVYHYRNGEDLFLLLNEDNAAPFAGKVTLPVSGRAVRYDAWENRLLPVKAEAKESGVTVELTLAPLEPCILLVGEDVPAVEAEPETACEEKLLTEFTVTRCEALEYPDFHDPETPDLARGMQALHPEFSGYYRYETRFTAAGKCLLTLEDAGECAEVFVNGRRAGLRVARPYVFDLTGLLREGENELAIEVATTLERKVLSMGDEPISLSTPTGIAPTGVVGEVKLLTAEQ